MTQKNRAASAADRRAFVKAGFTAAVDHYCFFDAKATDWEKVRALYRPLALAAESYEAFGAVAGQVLAGVAGRCTT